MAERLKEAREQAEKRLQELQKQMLDEKNEKEIVQEECYQMSSRIKNLEEENETVQQSLLFKHEEAEELQRTLGDKNLKLAELIKQGELLKASTA